MTEAKTRSAAFDSEVWLAGIDPARREEAERLLAIFAEATGWEPRLFGPSMVGFGRYVYRYESGHGGESLATGFSLRKAELSVYLMAGGETLQPILARLGPHRMGKACLYVKRLDAVDEGVLREAIRAGLEDLALHWPVHPV
ncbi:DUF1801 domain-containing protein [Tabrizicola sp.]|uniref:DUF1801 domain-containing protein n=1 Tax=Tabrizicola sp. TaxID=2005166 RepID=UPI0027366180|nr:DUF1801 domain-containing protein [Tabrizicola sp.]MDP3193644.1 DUF1801 domain-containing protein [Tabrizicola sp.]